MSRKIIIRFVVSILIVGLVFFAILFQEYRLTDTNELSIERVRQGNLVGDFIYPSTATALPVIVFLGGSGGGLRHEEELKALALNGYSVFSLAYFNEAGLPDKLENIPLEYFENAFNWLKNKRQVDSSRLLLLGLSRGAELALLLGSHYPQVKGVIAYSPSCFVLPNAIEIEKDSLIASWTFKGSPISSARIRRFEEVSTVDINYKKYIEPLLAQSIETEDHVIKVEKINGPVLLISGQQDLVWPASQMATRIEERLKNHSFHHGFKNIVFEHGGHDLLMFKNCYPIVSSIIFRKFKLTISGRQFEFNLGGTVSGVINSKVQSRRITLEFLDSFRNSPVNIGENLEHH